MTFNFSELPPPSFAGSEVDPIRLFGALQVRDRGINDLWLGQGDALREWHDKRNLADIAIVLNTGAGKTLVGLLAAQSLVNETSGHVAYVCASLQLVQQTADKAESYGLRTTTYVGGQGYSNTNYQEGLCPCITTYQALFNGLTQRWGDVEAVIFDDAHAATNIIREQFTLTIAKDKYPAVHAAVTAAFAEHLREFGSDLAFRQAVDIDDWRSRWFVPPFVIQRHSGVIENALLTADLQDDKAQMFPWGYLVDKLHVCACFISPTDVWFTPPVVPVRTLPYFRSEVRRIYLSATLAAEDAFLRTFGKVPDHVVSPETPAGNCERMILFPSVASDHTDEVAAAKAIIASAKALILVPTHRDGRIWDDIVTDYLGNTDATQIDTFKNASPPTKLRLIARYDGVDLPGDTCRMMVMHNLPSGLGPLERYLWETLGIFNVLRSTVASRVVQSFGRISRGMSDHGVVILTGKRLIDWLMIPSNRRALPSFLRRQIEVGLTVSKNASAEQFVALAQQCIDQDPNWCRYYRSAMTGVDEMRSADSGTALADAARVEAEFGHYLWNGYYEQAAQVLNSGRNLLFRVSKGIGAWYLLWSGYPHELFGAPDDAIRLYREARKAERAMPVVRQALAQSEPDYGIDSDQVGEVASFMLDPRDVLTGFDTETAALQGGSVAQMEEATRCLGTYLGLDSSRPDNDVGTGPDVLWYLEGKTAWVMELKTEKKGRNSYSKREIAQVGDHVRFVQANRKVAKIVPVIVGPHLPPDHRANPPDDLVVMDVTAVLALRRRVREALATIAGNRLPVLLSAEVARVYGDSGLLWSELSEHLPGNPIGSITSQTSSPTAP